MPRPDTPLLTVDIIIRLRNRSLGLVVLIERRNPPMGWALPGGFVDIGESLEAAAMREAKEETGLDVELEALLGCYSNPSRDPRGHMVSVVYMGSAEGEPVADDDAKNVRLADPSDDTLRLAFDHRQILDDYVRFRASGRPAPLRV